MADIRPFYGGTDPYALDKFEVKQLAGKMPATPGEAIATYFSRRRAIIRSGIEKLKDHELSSARNQDKAITEVLVALGADESDASRPIPAPTKKKRGRPKKRQPLPKVIDDRLIHLYNTLTPPGWEDLIMPRLRDYEEVCRNRILEGGPGEGVARAGLEECTRFKIVLRNTEREGFAAIQDAKMKRQAHG